MTAPEEALFPGTRVPVRALLDWLEQGETVAEFLRYFPSVSREQALAALERTAQGPGGVARRRPAGKPAPPA